VQHVYIFSVELTVAEGSCIKVSLQISKWLTQISFSAELKGEFHAYHFLFNFNNFVHKFNGASAYRLPKYVNP